MDGTNKRDRIRDVVRRAAVRALGSRCRPISEIVLDEQTVQGALNQQNEEWTVAQCELA